MNCTKNRFHSACQLCLIIGGCVEKDSEVQPRLRGEEHGDPLTTLLWAKEALVVVFAPRYSPACSGPLERIATQRLPPPLESMVQTGRVGP